MYSFFFPGQFGLEVFFILLSLSKNQAFGVIDFLFSIHWFPLCRFLISYCFLARLTLFFWCQCLRAEAQAPRGPLPSALLSERLRSVLAAPHNLHYVVFFSSLRSKSFPIFHLLFSLTGGWGRRLFASPIFSFCKHRGFSRYQPVINY